MSKLVVELEGIDKRHLAYVWEKMRDGRALQGDEVYIGRSMADHPEWYPFFSTIGILEGGDDELPDGSNPFAHVSMHILIASQIHHQTPPEAETFYRVRVRKGDAAHDVIHMMINVFQRHLLWTAQQKEEGGARFEMSAYAKTLKKLWKLKSHQIWARLGADQPD